jgi:hypothetical protein
MIKNTSKYFLPLVLILAVFFTYGGCNDSNGSNMGNINSDTENVFTPVVASVLAPPVPVKGSDGKFHIIYELNLTNSNTFDWEVASIEVLDGHPDGQVLKVISGDEVKDKMQLLGTRTPTNTLLPSQSALVYITFTVPSEEDIPDSLIHKLTITVPGGLPEFITLFLELPKVQEDISAFVAPVDVNKTDVFVSGPPLEGPGWVVVNGCCDAITHVRSNLAVNGKNYISQRYAIDWIKINKDNRLYVGDPQILDNWAGYNQNVLAVSDAQVVRVVDKYQDQVPFILPAAVGAITLEEIDGNNVILALPNGQFAYYAHLKPGSITVKEGDFVTKGQVIAKLGNTGNTSAPHLHLHIMETASSLGSNGLPYVFEEYYLIKQTTDESFFDEGLEDTTPFVDEETGQIIGNSIDVLPVAFPGDHKNDLPLNLRIVEFPNKNIK